MGEVIPFPAKRNGALDAFDRLRDYIATDTELTAMEFAELIFHMREFTDFCLASDKDLRKLYKMLYFN